MRLCLLAVAMVLGGCSAKPQLLKHYAEDMESSTGGTVKLSVFLANPKGADTSPLISGLHERAQAALVAAVAAKLPASATPKDLIAALETSAEPDEKPCAWADKTVVSKRLVFTLSGNLQRPADRVDKLEVDIAFEDRTARANFTSWDRFDSVYASFNLGTAKFTQTNKLTAGRTNTDTSNLPNAAGSVVKLLSFGAESTNALEESAAYAMRRLSVGGALGKDKATLVQEGGPNLNLFGTSTATVSLKLVPADDPRPVYKLGLSKAGQPVSPAEVSVERCQAKFASSSARPLMLKVTGKATLREVESGDATVMEGDDRLNVRVANLSTDDIELLSKDDLHFQTFGLVQCAAGQKLDDCKRLKVDLQEFGPNIPEELHLASASAAAALRTWLLEQSKKGDVKTIGARQVGMLSKDESNTLNGLNSATVSELRVVRLRENQ